MPDILLISKEWKLSLWTLPQHCQTFVVPIMHDIHELWNMMGETDAEKIAEMMRQPAGKKRYFEHMGTDSCLYLEK